MKVCIGYPAAEDELKILHLERNRLAGAPEAAPADPALTATQVLELRRAINGIYLDEMLERYIVALVGATREPARWDAELAEWLTRGASPRASLALAHTARAQALLAGRDFVEPDDILQLVPDVLNHRLGLSFAARSAGVSAERAIERIVACVPVP
jgi:MoxR-like ATPase